MRELCVRWNEDPTPRTSGSKYCRHDISSKKSRIHFFGRGGISSVSEIILGESTSSKSTSEINGTECLIVIVIFLFLQITENCDADPCYNNATCESFNTTQPGVVSSVAIKNCLSSCQKIPTSPIPVGNEF